MSASDRPPFTPPPRSVDEASHLADLDTSGAASDRSISEAQRQALAPQWQLRLLYIGGRGITDAMPLPWTTTRPLGMGRRRKTGSEDWLQVEDERVSREHARLHRHGTQVVIEDLGSRNGSWCNGARLSPGVAQPLHDGDILRVGDSFVLVRYEPLERSDVAIAAVIGVSAAASRLRAGIARAAASQRAVLIIGETGTGKEVTAQAIHQLCQRPGPLVTVNCAAIPSTLAESQLFGVARGAFTGAVAHHGLFGEADHGTLFLDEVGDLPRDLQPKLLRVLETHEVFAVGSQRATHRDVRILAATNRDLQQAMLEGQFRDDLYARLSADILLTPPLRSRREDILLLAQKLAAAPLQLTPPVVAALLSYDWPRNVRELGHVVRRIGDHSEDEIIQSLPAGQRTSVAPTPDSVDRRPPAAIPSPVQRWHHGDAIPSEKTIVALLQQYRGNLTRIEQTCGYSRRQFRRWIEQYGIDHSSFR